jgi:kinesin family protein 13
LEILFHDVRLNYHTPIISQQGEVAGRLQIEISRTSGQFPQDRICEATSECSGDSTYSEIEDFMGTRHITCRVTIKQASGLPLSLSHFVFCQYMFWGYSEPIVVPPIINTELPLFNCITKQKESLTFKFNQTNDFTVPITEEFMEHCTGKLKLTIFEVFVIYR